MKKVKLHNPFKPRITSEKDLREQLALQRTKLSNERTLLSYVRTSLYLLIGGIALIQIEEYPRLHWVGYLTLCICVIFIFIGISRYIVLEKRLKNLVLPGPEEVLEKNEA